MKLKSLRAGALIGGAAGARMTPSIFSAELAHAQTGSTPTCLTREQAPVALNDWANRP